MEGPVRSAETAPAGPLFDRQRMFHYPLIILAVFALGAVLLVATSRDMIDFRGKPLGYDFITFWGASDLTLEGRATDAFDPAEALKAQQKAVQGSEVDFFWHYPPTFQLVAAPLALLPYPIAYLAFVTAGFLAYLFALRPLLNQPRPMLVLAAFPAALICVFHGQNSLLSAALLGATIWLSERGPREQVLAGVCIGLLAFKPQLGLLLPVALALSRSWRTFASAAVTVTAFIGIATVVFGRELWGAFFADLPFVQLLLETGSLPWDKIVSTWVFLRMLGAPDAIAYPVHIAVALAAVALVVYVWLRCGKTRLAWAVLVVATLMIPHYAFDYELTLLAIPAAILASDMAERGASRADKLLLLAIVVLSGATAPISSVLHIQVAQPVLLAALWLTTRRALSAPGTRALLPFRKGNGRLASEAATPV